MEKYYYDGYEDSPKIQNNPLKVTETENKKIIDFYLINTIEEMGDYIDFLRAVDSCRPQDEVIVHINNYGGSSDVGMNIYDCLKGSDCNVIINVEGVCASCASIIMLAGNQWNVLPHAYVMVHSWSDCECGKWNEIKAKFKYDNDVYEKQFKEIYKNFLTDEEIEQCLNGKDLYFDAEETIKRLDNYQRDELNRQNEINKIDEKFLKLRNKEIDDYLKRQIKRKKNND